MLRISDGRMSGTPFGSVVLNVTPEPAAGGPPAWLHSGDRIRLSVARRELTLLVSAEGVDFDFMVPAQRNGRIPHQRT